MESFGLSLAVQSQMFHLGGNVPECRSKSRRRIEARNDPRAQSVARNALALIPRDMSEANNEREELQARTDSSDFTYSSSSIGRRER